MDWTFLKAFPTMELLMASCHENGFNKGRINVTATSRKRYFTCKISGCPKSLRAVTLLCEIAEEEEDFLHRFSLEDDVSVLHQHDALELPMRGDSFFFPKFLLSNFYNKCRNRMNLYLIYRSICCTKKNHRHT